MKKLILLLLVVSLCLSACGSKETTAAHTYEDLTIQIPTDFIDLSGEDFAEGLDFVFGLDPIAINGMREEKATFQAYGMELDLQRYAQLVIASNNVSSQLEQRDGITTFTYASGDFTYVVTLHETEDAFWTVQAYCATADYSKAESKIWEILSSVTV